MCFRIRRWRGTIAASLPDHVDPQIKKARSRSMRELGAMKKRDFCLRFRGEKASVLIEEKIDRATGLRRGFSRNYLPVAVHGCEDFVNQEVAVEIKDFEQGWLRGDASEMVSDHVECHGQSATNAG